MLAISDLADFASPDLAWRHQGAWPHQGTCTQRRRKKKGY